MTNQTGNQNGPNGKPQGLPRKKVGRPPRVPLVDPKVADAVCAWIAEGKTLREFCRQPGMPARRTIDEWRDLDAAFAARVARARDIGFEQIAEECKEIADTPTRGQVVMTEEGKVKVIEDDMLGHRKLQVETRLKLLACWDPRRYGSKVQVDSNAKVEHSGAVKVSAEAPKTLAEVQVWGDRLAALTNNPPTPPLLRGPQTHTNVHANGKNGNGTA